jgi:trafficking protein particle complex subunit 10
LLNSYLLVTVVEENDGFKILEKELRSATPFKAVKWTIKDGRPPEVCLDIVPRFIPDEKVPRPSGDTPAPTSHQEPYLRLYVVSCEDAEQYKVQIKPRIQKWLVAEAEHLVIHVSQKEPGFFSKNVFQLLRADFGGPKSDRCVAWHLSSLTLLLMRTMQGYSTQVIRL